MLEGNRRSVLDYDGLDDEYMANELPIPYLESPGLSSPFVPDIKGVDRSCLSNLWASQSPVLPALQYSNEAPSAGDPYCPKYKPETDSTVNPSTTLPALFAQNARTSDIGCSLRPSKELTFINKLWFIVNDPQTDHIIRWAKCGSWFGIRDSNIFSKTILPVHFKHRNMTSFVRQLNIYGFRKVVHTRSRIPSDSSPMDWTLKPSANGLEDGDPAAYVIVEGFAHPQFVRDGPHLIEQISRRPTALQTQIGTVRQPQPSDPMNHRAPSNAQYTANTYTPVNDSVPEPCDHRLGGCCSSRMERVESVSRHAQFIDDLYRKCDILQRQQDTHWQDMEKLRLTVIAVAKTLTEVNEKFSRQQQVIQRLISFLANLMPTSRFPEGPTASSNPCELAECCWPSGPYARQQPLMIESGHRNQDGSLPIVSGRSQEQSSSAVVPSGPSTSSLAIPSLNLVPLEPLNEQGQRKRVGQSVADGSSKKSCRDAIPSFHQNANTSRPHKSASRGQDALKVQATVDPATHKESYIPIGDLDDIFTID